MSIRLAGRYSPQGKLLFRKAVSKLPVVPVFTTLPVIDPTSGPIGTIFTATNGVASGATAYTRKWYLNGVEIRNQTGLTYKSDGIGSLTVRVTATGPGGTVAAESAPVTVTSTVTPQNAPVFTTLPGLLGTFAEGTSISVPIVVEDAEDNVSTWSIIGGELPPGVTLDMFSGVIAGQLGEVTADATFSFRIKVTDRTDLSVEGNFSINVANVKTTVTWETESGTVGEPAPGEPVMINLGASSV